MPGHAWRRGGLGHLVDLLVAWAKHFGTVPVGAVSCKVTMLLACKARSVVEWILVRRHLIGYFQLLFAWQRLCKHRGWSWVLRGCRVVGVRRHNMGLRNLSLLQLLQRLTVLVVWNKWRFLSI